MCSVIVMIEQVVDEALCKKTKRLCQWLGEILNLKDLKGFIFQKERQNKSGEYYSFHRYSFSLPRHSSHNKRESREYLTGVSTSWAGVAPCRSVQPQLSTLCLIICLIIWLMSPSTRSILRYVSYPNSGHPN